MNNSNSEIENNTNVEVKTNSNSEIENNTNNNSEINLLKNTNNKLIKNIQNVSDIKLYMIKNKQIIFKNFEDYNIYLVNYSIKINIKDYIECIHPHLFKHIDISILTNFLNYSKEDTLYNISSNDLLYYKLINDNSDETINIYIKNYNLKIDKDYRVRKINKNKNKNLLINLKENVQDSSKENFKEYRFTSRSLKKSLIKLDENYIDYYFLLENCIEHYTNYQNNLYYKLSFIRDIKLDNLIKNFETQNNIVINLSKKLEDLYIKNKLIYDNINCAHNKINNLTNLFEKNNQYNNNLKNNKFNQILYTFSLYQIDNKKLFYIDTYSELIKQAVKKNSLKYNYFELLYSIEYNAKYIDIISKVKNKFNNDLELFNSEIIILNKNLNQNHLINFIKEEVSKFT